MRGNVDRQHTMFVMINVETRIPKDHPLRAVKLRCDNILAHMRKDFNKAYSHTGRPGVPPEQLLKALLLQALYSIRSEIQLMQAIEFNLLYRWFLDIPGDANVWTPEVFSMNRKRFAEHGLVRKFFERIVHDAITDKLISDEHFTADGTLIRSWASLKSIRPRDKAGCDADNGDDNDKGNRMVSWHGQRRSNATHVSTTDPEALLARKGGGKEAHLCHSGHVFMENRHGLCVDVEIDAADGRAERRSVKKILKRLRRRHKILPGTIGFDAGYDDGGFLLELEQQGIVPHVPLKKDHIVAKDAPAQARRRAKRRRTTAGYQVSQRLRKKVEEIFGWLKTVGGMARAHHVGRWKIRQQMLICASAYNLLRIVRLESAA